MNSTTLPSGRAEPACERPIANTVAYYAAFVALGLTGVSLGPTLPFLAQHTHSQLSQISFLFSARSLGYLLGSIGGGRLYDRRWGHRLMAGVLLVMAATAALAPVVERLWLLAAVLLVLGVGEGALDVGGNTLLVWVHRDRVGPFMNGLHFFFGLGGLIMPVLVAQAIRRTGDVYWAYWAAAVLLVPAALRLLSLASPRAPAPARDGAARRVDPVLVAMLAAFFFLHVGAEASYGGWICTYAVRLGLSDQANGAYLTSGFWGALTAGRLLAIPIAARTSPQRMLLADLLGAFAGTAIILLCPGSLVALWLGTCLAGLSIASLFPTSISLAERRLPITGQVTGWFLVGAAAAGMTVPWLIGQLFEPVGPRVTMVVVLVDLLVALAVYAALSLYAPRPARATQ